MILRLSLVALGFFAIVEATTEFNREQGFFSNSFNGAVAPDDYLEISPANDGFGGEYEVDFFADTGYKANIYGAQISHFKFFDVGFAECSSTGTISSTVTAAGDLPTVDAATGTALEPNKCLVVPYLMDVSQPKYLMAVSVVQETQIHTLYKVQRVTAEVNRARHQWREKWVCKAAIIATWQIDDGAGNVNTFQTVIAVGLTDGGVEETYILFIYETDSLPITGLGVQGFVNGEYAAAPSLFGKVCPETGNAANTGPPTAAFLYTHSNFKCGKPGVFVLPVGADGFATCDEADPCSLTVVNPNCNLTVAPFDTCKESFSCHATASQITLNIYVKWPVWPLLQALDQEKWEANQEQLLINGANCQMTFNLYNTEASGGEYTVQIPKQNTALIGSICGTVVDTGTASVKFAYKLWDGTPASMMIDRYGNMVIEGECFYDDLPPVITQTPMFNEPNPVTELPARTRVLKLEVIDRPDADGHFVINSAKIGRPLWLLVTFDPGTPWNLWADPFGAYVIDCWVANNPDFLHEPTGEEWKKSQKFIEDGCGIEKAAGALEAIWLDTAEKSFESDPDHMPDPPTGGAWYLVAGKFIAAKWAKGPDGSAPVDEMYFRCTVSFCTLNAERATCVDNCATDRRKRRSVSNNGEIETVYTKIVLTDGDEATENASQTSDSATCTNFRTAVSTVAVLLALLVLAVIGCILIMLKWVSVKKKVNRSKKEST